MRLAFLFGVAVACASPPGSAADTANLVRVAKQQSPRPDSARITQLVIAGDTARVTVSTHDQEKYTATWQHLAFVRTTDGWKLDDTRPSSDSSVMAAPPFKVP